MKYLFVLGNGFSLDLLSFLDKKSDIPLTNLFAYGDKLSWPTNDNNAFISFRNTPNLWILGVRPSGSETKNNQIIENVITCANAYYLKPKSGRTYGVDDQRKIYIKAYKELVVYLKYLFVQFDKAVSIDSNQIVDWTWSKVFKRLHEDKAVSNVFFVTFNYDVWLERVLEALKIEYSVSGFEEENDLKFTIVKPHGSISFMHKTSLDMAAFDIGYDDGEIVEAEMSDFQLKMDDLDTHCPVIPIIPPAGDSGRFNVKWAMAQRDNAKKNAKSMVEEDNVVICGLSYWHVDRKEIDDVLLNLSEVLELAFINPTPPETFDAVLTSLFSKYEHYSSVERYFGVDNV